MMILQIVSLDHLLWSLIFELWESQNYHLLFFYYVVICWVLVEYGTADGKYSASYITGKLCDVAETHPEDDTVKAYTITGIMKVYSFEIVAGRTVDILPECQSLIEEMLASSSTDLQQRAYELQAVLTLDAQAVKKIMPMDSTCNDVEIDKSLPFLDGYVQAAIENGAQPYIPESERLGTSSISNFKSHDDHESSTHALRFEAYEYPKPALPHNAPPALASSTELVPVPEPSYAATDVFHPTSVPSASDAGPSELKLRLDGVQKKWGRPSYSSPAPSSSSTDTKKIQNELKTDSVGSSKSKAPDTSYDSRKQQVEISPEKQKLAASLFGGSSKSEGRQHPPSHKTWKTQNHTSDKSHPSKTSAFDTSVKTSHPPPDLLDLGEPSVASSTPSVDPFKQFEGLFDFTHETSPGEVGDATKDSDAMSLFAGMSLSVQSQIDLEQASSIERKSIGGSKVEASAQWNKGPNLKEALEKDALVRQMGYTPTGQNPNLFKDLLG